MHDFTVQGAEITLRHFVWLKHSNSTVLTAAVFLEGILNFLHSRASVRDQTLFSIPCAR